MKRLILTAFAVLCLSASLLAQNQAALAILAQLDTEAARAKPGTTRNTRAVPRLPTACRVPCGASACGVRCLTVG
jgi:hypothetical protein